MRISAPNIISPALDLMRFSVDEASKPISALIIGANGIAGANMLAMLCRETNWQLHAVARWHPAAIDRINRISVDLLDEAAAHAALAAIGPVDYIFYAALVEASTPAEQVAPNLALLRNSVSPIIKAGAGLRHVCVVQGTKWYGSHLGPYRTPARENDPRHPGPNFYYDQHDWLSAFQRGSSWTFSTLRPHFISGFNVGNPHNMMAAVGAYAAVKRELGEPLDFPGTLESFETLSMATNVGLLNKAMLWSATSPACANHDFNITNGDYFRWKNVWPAIADSFDMALGGIATLQLSDYMAGKEALWTAICRRNGLPPRPIHSLAGWRWADFLFRGNWDDISSTIKARRFGFSECVDTEEDMLKSLERYRAERVLP
jgi:nucleoside-diphosphate-sugar epimerase